MLVHQNLVNCLPRQHFGALNSCAVLLQSDSERAYNARKLIARPWCPQKICVRKKKAARINDAIKCCLTKFWDTNCFNVRILRRLRSPDSRQWWARSLRSDFFCEKDFSRLRWEGSTIHSNAKNLCWGCWGDFGLSGWGGALKVWIVLCGVRADMHDL